MSTCVCGAFVRGGLTDDATTRVRLILNSIKKSQRPSYRLTHTDAHKRTRTRTQRRPLPDIKFEARLKSRGEEKEREEGLGIGL